MTVKGLIKTRCAFGHGLNFSPHRKVDFGYFILREYGMKRTFRDACTAVNTGIRVNIKPGPLFLGFPRDNALNWTDCNTAAFTHT
jgi:hypothetical protein